ncbi:hypothetical protein Tco_0731179 [Tanacetum coccineum]
MAEPILNKSMEKAQSESYLSITSNDIKINLSKEFVEELQKNTCHEWIDKDVINHIAKVLEIVDLIRVPGTDSHQLLLDPSRPNGKLIYNSIINGPYVRRMIPEPGDAARTVPVPETFHEQTDDELTEA